MLDMEDWQEKFTIFVIVISSEENWNNRIGYVLFLETFQYYFWLGSGKEGNNDLKHTGFVRRNWRE